MLKSEKERVVAELTDRLKASETLMVADYRGLDVTQLNDVRTELLKHGARFSVVKNTLAKRAAEEAGASALVELLDGPTAIAFVGDGDMVAIAKALSDAARETKVLTVKGGMLDGEPITADQVKNLASLPPTDVLRGQMLAVIVGPMASIVGIFTAPLRDLVGVVDARIRQLEEQGESAEPPAEEPAAESEEAPEAEDQPEPTAEAEAETTEHEPAADAEAETTEQEPAAEAEAGTTEEEPADEAEPETKEEEE
jgi:large subunit ribosomal protein L10